MSKLREIASEDGIKELLMCYGDDKETSCWMYPPKKFKSFSATSYTNSRRPKSENSTNLKGRKNENQFNN